MDKKFELLYDILKELQNAGVLKHLVLIGSWCQYFYRHHYENAFQIPATRTLDADILIPRRIKLSQPVNIHEILLRHGFAVAADLEGKVAKYLHRDLSFEFLTDAGAQADETELRIPALNIVAQELHFLGIPFDYRMTIEYRDLSLNIPEPEAFALHKLIVSQLRKDVEKKSKDIETVSGMFQFFKGKEKHIRRLHQIMGELPGGWRKKIRNALQNTGLTLPE